MKIEKIYTMNGYENMSGEPILEPETTRLGGGGKMETREDFVARISEDEDYSEIYQEELNNEDWDFVIFYSGCKNIFYKLNDIYDQIIYTFKLLEREDENGDFYAIPEKEIEKLISTNPYFVEELKEEGLSLDFASKEIFKIIDIY